MEELTPVATLDDVTVVYGGQTALAGVTVAATLPLCSINYVAFGAMASSSTSKINVALGGMAPG